MQCEHSSHEDEGQKVKPKLLDFDESTINKISDPMSKKTVNELHSSLNQGSQEKE